ncbi:MAG TPA: hypothetical protein VMS98_15615, partial [Thermoanaerobaculia bacterium]|nr:hypothetical protein [Thermoanaerobaculia bacterium]
AGAPAAQPNQITITFPSPTTAASGTLQITPSGVIPQPNEQLFGEITKYRVYRGTASDFTPGAANEIKTNLTDPTYTKTTVQIQSTTVTIVDKTAPNCITYYYKFQAVEPCGETTATCPAACNTGGAEGVSALFPATGVAAVSTATADPAAPSTLKLLPTSLCSGPRCDVFLAWDRVKEDLAVPANTITVETYRVTRTRYLNGVVDINRANPEGAAVQTFDVTDGTPLADGDLPWSQLGIPSRQGGVDYEYVYSVRAMQCPDTSTPPVYRMSAPSPEVRFPCTFLTTLPDVFVTETLDGDGVDASTAWLTNNPASTVEVTAVDPSLIASVQAVLDNGAQTIDLGTLLMPTIGSKYSFPLSNTQIGELYEILVFVKDTGGCVRTVSKWVEEATQTGCCLAAFVNDPSVVKYTPGTNFVDVTLKNLCAQDLNLENIGVQIQWDPVIAGNLTATTLTTVEFPSTGTGSAVAVVNDLAPAGSMALRTLKLSPPTSTTPPGRLIVPANSSNYVVRYNFDKILNSPNPSGPIVNSCIIYQRATIDTTPQNCQIIPEPPGFNTCNF